MSDENNDNLPSGLALLYKNKQTKLSAASKVELVMNLLNPVNEDDEPQEPLITPEQARELLGFKDE